MSNQWVTRNGRTSKRGLFAKGIWHCDCEPRLPAEKFQVKNGGKNHGRWFFTCQKAQPQRCGFFLWSDDAKVREEAAVLSNSRTEPGRAGELGQGGRLRSDLETPQTPRKQIKITQPITPTSKAREPVKDSTGKPIGFAGNEPHKYTFSLDSIQDESFDWSSSGDDELLQFAESMETGNETLDEDESPRKIARTPQQTSPSKRNHDEISQLASSGTHLLTPSTSTKHDTSGLLSPGTTPARIRLGPGAQDDFEAPADAAKALSEELAEDPAEGPAELPAEEEIESPSEEETEEPFALALQALKILSPVKSKLPPYTKRMLIALLNKHELKSQGNAKGRDLARAAIQTREKRIAELHQKIANLESEKETTRIVIQHLKSDIATSPKKPRRPGGESFKRFEV